MANHTFKRRLKRPLGALAWAWAMLWVLLSAPNSALAYDINERQLDSMKQALNLIYSRHAKPLQSWSELSESIHDAFVNAADTKRLFWRSDYDAIAYHAGQIHQQIMGQEQVRFPNDIAGTQITFLGDYVEILRKRAKESIDLLRNMVKANWYYDSYEFYDPNPLRWEPPNDASGARKAWELFVRHEVLEVYHAKRLKEGKEGEEGESAKETSDIAAMKRAFLNEEPKLRRQVIDDNLSKLSRLIKAPMVEWFNTFLGRLVYAHDPHSGVMFKTRKYVKPAYAYAFRNKPYSVHQIEGIIEAPEAIPNKQRVNTALLRDKNETETTFAYLGLNAFHSNKKESASQRVLAALNYFASQGTKGLVLDLRNNPGGHVKETLQILGYFLGDKKPAIYSLVSKPVLDQLFKNKVDKKPYLIKEHKFSKEAGKLGFYVFKDLTLGQQVHKNPLVVLVNERTASGGEAASLVLKDYRRAVVVGPERTYGKGTGQSRFSVAPREGEKPFHFKLTVLLYYGMRGTSVQSHGLVPNVVLPSTFRLYHRGVAFEDEFFNTIEPPKIEIDEPPKSGLDVGPLLESVRSRSKSRVLNSTFFQYVRGALRSMESKSTYEQIPLNYQHYLAYRHRSRHLRNDLLELQESLPRVFEAVDSGQSDGLTKPILRAMERDPYVLEAYHILLGLAATPQ